MYTMYVTRPLSKIYLQPYSGKDKKEAILKIIDAFAPKAYDVAKIKKTMTYQEIEDRLADEYLADYDAPRYPEYFEVHARVDGRMRKLF